MKYFKKQPILKSLYSEERGEEFYLEYKGNCENKRYYFSGVAVGSIVISIALIIVNFFQGGFNV